MSWRSAQWPKTARQGLSLVVAVSLATSSGVAAAAPPAAEESADLDAAAGEGGGDGATETPKPEPAPSEPGGPTSATDEAATRAGMGGSVISSTNPEARRARADLEGTALLDAGADVPERLPPLQRAAWWTMFGTFALATAGGVFAGLAEVQEDRAQRLASTIDLTAGGAFVYGDKEAEYQDILAKGERQAWVARGLLIGAGISLIAGVSLFAVHARKTRRRGDARARLRPAGGGLEVRF